MKRHHFAARTAAWAAIASSCLQPAAVAVEPGVLPVRNDVQPAASRAADVTLDARGGLVGVVVTPQGVPVAGKTVSIAGLREPLTTTTDAQGKFRIEGAPAGVRQVQVGLQSQSCRIWTAEAAPPRAVTKLMVVEDARIALAQNMPGPLVTSMETARQALGNPLVVGGIVAAAIAIPVALNNSGNDDSSS